MLVAILLLLFIAGSLLSLGGGGPTKWQRMDGYLSSAAGSFTGIILSIAVLMNNVDFTFSLWEVAPGLALHLRLDSLSAFFLLILSLVGLALSVYGIGYGREYEEKGKGKWVGGFWNLFFLTMIMVFLAEDAFTFLFFWEAMSLVSFLLVMTEHEKEQVRKAGFLYVGMTHLGTFFLFVVFLLFYQKTGSLMFADWEGQMSRFGPIETPLLFLFLLIGFGTKAGLIPLHVWLPRAHPAAPSHVSAMMSGVMLKVAIYGMVRFFIQILGGAPAWMGYLLLSVGAVSALIGILYGTAENEMKRFLAYSSSENMGIIVMGMGAALLFQAGGNEALFSFALAAALFHTVSHALFKGVLFMGAGSVLFATHTQNGNLLGGLIHRMPQTAFLFLVGGLAMAAFPPLSGFIGEWMLYQSLFSLSAHAPSVWQGLIGILSAVILGMTGVLAAGGVVKHFGAGFLGSARTKAAEEAREVPLPMRIGMGLLAAFLVFFGIFPTLLLGLIHPVLAGLGMKAAFASPFVITAGEEGGSLVPLLLPFLLALLLAGAYFYINHRFGKLRIRKGGTWNCGTPYQPAMSYTATSISHPLLLMFRPLFRVKREVAARGEYAYFPKALIVEVKTHALFETYLYRPLLQGVLFFSRLVRRVQNGSLQAYLLYMVITLILLMLWAQRG